MTTSARARSLPVWCSTTTPRITAACKAPAASVASIHLHIGSDRMTLNVGPECRKNRRKRLRAQAKGPGRVLGNTETISGAFADFVARFARWTGQRPILLRCALRPARAVGRSGLHREIRTIDACGCEVLARSRDHTGIGRRNIRLLGWIAL